MRHDHPEMTFVRRLPFAPWVRVPGDAWAEAEARAVAGPGWEPWDVSSWYAAGLRPRGAIYVADWALKVLFPATLSLHEECVLRLVGARSEGATVPEIAEALLLSARTTRKVVQALARHGLLEKYPDRWKRGRTHRHLAPVWRLRVGRYSIIGGQPCPCVS